MSLPALGYRVHPRVTKVVVAVVLVLIVVDTAALLRRAMTPRFPFRVLQQHGPPVIGAVANRGELGGDRLAVGDVIVRVDGTPVRDHLLALTLIRRNPPGSDVTLELDRGGLTVKATVRSLSRVFPVSIGWITRVLFVLVCWAVIALILWRRPRDPVAVLTALVGGAGLTATSIQDPGLGYGSLQWRAFWTAVFMIAVGLEAAGFLHWCLRYPVRITIRRWVLPAIYGTTSIGILVALSLLGRAYPLGHFDPVYRGVVFQLTLNIFFTLAGLGVMVTVYWRALSPERRLQTKWVILGLCIGLLPQVLIMNLSRALDVETPVPMILVDLCYLAIPLGFLASIFRYRLFDVDLIAGRSIVVGGMLLAVVMVRAALRLLDLPVGLETPTMQWAGSVLLVGVPAIVMRRQLDRPLGVPGLRGEQVRRRIDAALSSGGDPEALTRRALEVLIDALDIERGAVLVRDSAGRRLVCVHALGFLHLNKAEVHLGASGPLVTSLLAQNGVMRSRSYDRPLGLALLPPAERDLMERLDSAVLLPLLDSGRLLGLITLSAHRTGSLPNSAVLKLLERLATAISRAIVKSMTERSTISMADLERFRTNEAEARELSSGMAGAMSVPGGRIGPYHLIEILGTGSAGEAWRARHEPSRREVAVKILRRDPGTDARGFRRFLEEIATLSEINDPHVVQVLDYGNTEGVPWFAMELVEGETLGQRLMRFGALEPSAALKIGQQVARGLAACHGVGVIHRDLSLANILLSGDRVRIADLGLAHRLDVNRGESARTQTVIAGTILYMSPEQISGSRLSYASDLFSLGAVLYECLTGRAPFEGPNLAETVENIRRARFIPLGERAPDLPEAVLEMISELLAREAERRPMPAMRVARELDRLSRSPMHGFKKSA